MNNIKWDAVNRCFVIGDSIEVRGEVFVCASRLNELSPALLSGYSAARDAAVEKLRSDVANEAP